MGYLTKSVSDFRSKRIIGLTPCCIKKVFASDKHSSLFCSSVNDVKKFYGLAGKFFVIFSKIDDSD